MDKSKRNRNADKNPSYKARNMSEAQIKAKRKYDSEYQKSPSRVKYRVELNKANRESHKKGTTKVGDNRDKSHTKSGKLVNESQSKNRARNKSNGKSSKK